MPAELEKPIVMGYIARWSPCRVPRACAWSSSSTITDRLMSTSSVTFKVKINLGSDGAPVVVWADGVTSGEIRRTMRIVTENQTALLARWEDIHGRTD